MSEDETILEFGNYFRWRIAERGGIADAADALGISEASVARYAKAVTREETGMLPRTAFAIAKHLGFDSIVALDRAWATTPLPPFPKRENRALLAMTAADVAKWFTVAKPIEVAEVLSQQAHRLTGADVMKWIDGADLEDVRDVLEHAGSRVDAAEGFKVGHHIRAARKRPKPGDEDALKRKK